MKKLLSALILLVLALNVSAQDDFGMWYSVGAEKKIDKN